MTAIALQFPEAIESKNIAANNNIHILPNIYIIYNVAIHFPLICNGIISDIKIDEIGNAIPNNIPNINLRMINYLRF